MKAPKEFRAYGYKFILLRQEKRIALYRQQRGIKVYGYEVHVLDARKPYTQPKSKFGIYAWSFPDLKSATDKFDELTRWEFDIRR